MNHPVLANSLTLAVTWSPFVRGIVVVMIGVGVLIGSVYLLLGTNLGARLGFQVTLAGLFGWLALMGGIWCIYGSGLKGKDPSWQPKAVYVGTDLMSQNPVLSGDPTSATGTQTVNGWRLLPSDATERSQAIAASDDILQNRAKVFQAGDYLSGSVWDKGGERYPKLGNSLDFIAFWHRPHYALVEVQPVIKQATEPGKAPPSPQVDPNAPKRFVLMERNLGNKRRPTFLIFLGSTIIFLWLCYSLHRREKLVTAHRSETGAQLEPVSAGV